MRSRHFMINLNLALVLLCSTSSISTVDIFGRWDSAVDETESDTSLFKQSEVAHAHRLPWLLLTSKRKKNILSVYNPLSKPWFTTRYDLIQVVSPPLPKSHSDSLGFPYGCWLFWLTNLNPPFPTKLVEGQLQLVPGRCLWFCWVGW